jgi:hypothetical protein
MLYCYMIILTFILLLFFVLFLWTIVLSVLLFIASDNLFGTFKHFLQVQQLTLIYLLTRTDSAIEPVVLGTCLFIVLVYGKPVVASTVTVNIQVNRPSLTNFYIAFVFISMAIN